MTTERPISEFVQVDTSPERLARIWTGVSAELERPNRSITRGARRIGWAWATASVLATAAATAALVGVYVEGQTSPSILSGAALETASDAMQVDLDDGSQLRLSAHSRVEVEQSDASAVELKLLRGEVGCQVTPNRKRNFDVIARGVRVRVTGTRFSVAVANDTRVTVSVSRGTVEVTPPGSSEVRRLSAGEQWTLETRVPRVADATESQPSPEVTASAEPDPVPEAAPAVKSGPATSTPKEADERPKPADDPELDARTLLDQGNAARRAGDAAGAARAYEELLTRFPGDARAGLAAFELGRLRMDRLGNLSGATQALRTAVKLAPGSAFREDAIARLVQAYAAMGATAQCRTFRKAYLEAYPKGVHAGTVANKCPVP